MKRRSFIQLPILASVININPLVTFAQTAKNTAPLTSADSFPIPRVVSGLNIELLDIDVAKDRTTEIWADRLTIMEPIKTLGHDLIIHAREIRFKRKAIFDLSGLSAVPDNTGKKASDGLRPGANGQDGADGGNGGNAGSAMIFANIINGKVIIHSTGADGGGAESGGNGANGMPGGAQAQHCATGVKGGRGGDAGKAGIPGNGGDGGTVLVFTSADIKTDILVKGGNAGTQAEHGTIGEGGPGGPGGKEKWEREFEGPRDHGNKR